MCQFGYKNQSQTVCMFFSRNTNTEIGDPAVMIEGSRFKVGHEIKYLGVIIVSSSKLRTCK